MAHSRAWDLRQDESVPDDDGCCFDLPDFLSRESWLGRRVESERDRIEHER